MRKILISLLLTALLPLSPLCHADIPNQVVMHYTGDVIVKPCTVSTDTVLLKIGDVDISKLSAPYAASDWFNTNVRFSNCDQGVNVNIILFNTGISPLALTSPNSPCGYFTTSAMTNGEQIQDIPYGIEMLTTLSGTDHNLACTGGVTVSPLNRQSADATSFDFPIKARLVHLKGEPVPMKISGVLAYAYVSYK